MNGTAAHTTMVAVAVLLTVSAGSKAQTPVAEPLQLLFNGTGLGDNRAIVTTPDGRHLYAAGNGNRALVAFSRTDGNGRLLQIEVYREGVGGVAGVARIARMALSPDTEFLYGVGGSSVAVFNRNTESGTLSFRQLVSGDFGISQAVAVAATPDGRTLYVVGSSSIAVFAIGADGRLTHATTLTDRLQVDSLGGASAVVVSPDSAYVYVASGFDRSITVFRRQQQSLTVVQVASPATGPSESFGDHTDLWLAPGGEQLYTAIRDRDAIGVFSRDPASGRISPLGSIADEGRDRGLRSPTRLIGSDDGSRLYVASSANSSVAQLQREPETGLLTFLKAAFSNRDGTIGMTGAADIALGPAQTHVYVSGPGDSAIAVFDAALTFKAIERNNAGAVIGLRQPAAVVVTPDGAHVYSAGFGDGSVSIFRRDQDGTLTFEAVFRGSGGGRLAQPISLATTSTGAILLVADFGAGSIQALDRAPDTGRLTPAAQIGTSNGIPDLRGVASVTVSGDDSLVAAVSILRDAVILLELSRDPTRLTFRATMPALDQPTSVLFSPDGRYLYNSSAGNDAILVFERTEANAAFPQVQVVRDGEDGISGLDGAAALAVTASGDRVYAASGGGIFQVDGSDSVVALKRSESDGTLQFAEAIFADQIDEDGLRGAAAVAVSPDGSLVAVTGFIGNSVTFLHRVPGGDDLEVAQVFVDGENGADGLAGATALAFSPSGSELYVAGFADDALTVLKIVPTTPPCPGDCDESGRPEIPELIRCVNLALSGAAPTNCTACDADNSGRVGINDLIQAVNASLHGCPSGMS